MDSDWEVDCSTPFRSPTGTVPHCTWGKYLETRLPAAYNTAHLQSQRGWKPRLQNNPLFPLPHSHFPIPRSPFPVPHSPFPPKCDCAVKSILITYHANLFEEWQRRRRGCDVA